MGGVLDAIWFMALVICVSCAIYGFYLVGQSSGFENELLTKAAVFIEDIFNKVVGLFSN